MQRNQWNRDCSTLYLQIMHVAAYWRTLSPQTSWYEGWVLKFICRGAFIQSSLARIQARFWVLPGGKHFRQANPYLSPGWNRKSQSGPWGLDMHTPVYMHASCHWKSISPLSTVSWLNPSPPFRSCSVIRSPTAPQVAFAPTCHVPHNTEVGRDHLLIMKALSQLVWWNVAQ